MNTPLHSAAQADPLAHWCRDFYLEMVKAGFTPEQALALTGRALNAMIRKAP